MYRISAHFSQSGLEPFNMHGIYRCLDTNTLMHHLLHFIMSHFKKKVSGENEIHTFSSTMTRCKNMSELGSFMSVGCFHIRTTLTTAFVRWLNSQVSHNQDSSSNWFPGHKHERVGKTEGQIWMDTYDNSINYGLMYL